MKLQSTTDMVPPVVHRTSTVWLVAQASDTCRLVHSGFEYDDAFVLRRTLNNLEDLAGALGQSVCDAVLIDIDPDPTRMLASLEEIILRFPEIRFVVLSNSLSNDLVLEAMQVGARHFMLKGSITTELVSVLNRLLQNNTPAKATSGRAVTVLSTSGGCGATTVAVNLAYEMHLRSKSPALLVDLDCHYGGAATYLGVSGDYGLADVLDREGELDAELIKSTAQSYSDGLRMLVNPCSISLRNPAHLNFQRLKEGITACRETFEDVVIDAPRLPMAVTADLIRVSQASLVVLQLTVKDLSMARAMFTALKQLGVCTDQIKAVVNGYTRRRAMIPLDEAQKALGCTELVCIAEDSKSAQEALNYGRPLAAAASRCPLRRDIKQLADRLMSV